MHLETNHKNIVDERKQLKKVTKNINVALGNIVKDQFSKVMT